MAELKLISWNVNGIRAAAGKGLLEFIKTGKYDIICLQETKVSDHAVLHSDLREIDGYFSFWHGAQEKKGYSGVAVYSKENPINVKMDFGDNLLSKEGRVIELDYGDFVLLNVYFPNGGSGETRLKYKLEFYKEFLEYIKKIKKPVIFCGDVNTAHQEIDLARPKENEKNSGFMPAERDWLDKFVEADFIDTYRLINPKKIEYSWWDMKTLARNRNVGWRIDYFFVSEKLKKNIKDAFILTDVYGSDHCPVGLKLEV